MQMPYFIRRLIRKHHWNAYGNTNKRIRELERARTILAEQGDTEQALVYNDEINGLYVKRDKLYPKLTQEV